MSTKSTSAILLEIAIVLLVMLGVKDLADRVNLIGAGSFAMWCGIGVATVYMKKEKRTWKALGFGLPTGWKSWLKSVGLSLVLIVSVIVFMALLLPIITGFIGVEIPQSSTDRFEFFLGQPLLFIAYLVVVIWLGAAVGEELLMRGFLLNRLADIFGQKRGGWVAAMVVHAVIFGLLHVSQGVPGIIATGVVALIFGCAYLFGKRQLFPVILAHGVVNTISLTAYYISDGKIT